MKASEVRASLLWASGITLPTLADPAAAADIADGKEAIGQDGSKIVGTSMFLMENYAGAIFVMFDHGYGAPNLPASVVLIAPFVTCFREVFSGQPNMLSLDLTISDNVTGMYRAFYNTALTELTLNFSTALCQDFHQFCQYSGDLETINGALSFASATDVDNAFGSCPALVDIEFAASSIPLSLSLADCPLLSDASLLYLANGLDAAHPSTLTLHATAKANMDNLMVDNVDGVAVAGSAMTLTAFVTGVKGWTVV